MPWPAMRLGEGRDSKAALTKIFEIEGIPSLVVVKMRGGDDGATPTVFDKSARGKIESAPDAWPWGPTPSCSLEEATEFINDAPVAVLFTDKLTDAKNEEAMLAAFAAAAAEHFDGAKCAPRGNLRFAVAADGDRAVDSVRKFLGILQVFNIPNLSFIALITPSPPLTPSL